MNERRARSEVPTVGSDTGSFFDGVAASGKLHPVVGSGTLGIVRGRRRRSVWPFALLSAVVWLGLLWGSTVVWASQIITPCDAIDCEPPNRAATSFGFVGIVIPLAIATATLGWMLIVGLSTHRAFPVHPGVYLWTAFCSAVVTVFGLACLISLMAAGAPAPILWMTVVLGGVGPPVGTVYFIARDADQRAEILAWKARKINA